MSELAQCPVCGAGILKDSYGWRFTEKIRVITYKCFGKLRVGEGEIVTCPSAGRIAIKQQSIITALRKQLAAMQSDYEVGKAIRELSADYTITNDGLVKWEITRWSGSFQHQHYEGDTVLECLLAAGLLDKEAAR